MPPRKDTRRPPLRRAPESRALPYGGRNVRFFALGLVFIAVGYFCLSRPPVDGFLSLTLAPILLGIGYCVLVPMGLLMGNKTNEAMPQSQKPGL